MYANVSSSSISLRLAPNPLAFILVPNTILTGVYRWRESIEIYIHLTVQEIDSDTNNEIQIPFEVCHLLLLRL